MNDCETVNGQDSEVLHVQDEPIKSLRDIISIRNVIQANLRNQAIFTIGINTCLLPEHLVQITCGHISHINSDGIIELTDESTGNPVRFILNEKSVSIARKLIETENSNDDEHLFQSQRGGPLNKHSLGRLITSWCSAVNLKGNYGSHSLRKTWGYHQYFTFHTSIHNVMKSFGHENYVDTLDYLLINIKNRDDIFKHEL